MIIFGLKMSKLYEAGHLGGCVKGGDPDTYYPKLWKWLVDKHLRVKHNKNGEIGMMINPTLSMSYGYSVLDVGCGEGHALNQFHRIGCRVIGIEGLANITKPSLPVIIHDLTKGCVRVANIDLVWCCEVVEHIEEKYINNLMQTLANGRIVAMTHALPGQKGYHHVNCKPREYWIYQFKRYGYKLLETDTEESKNYGHKFWTWSGMIFERNNGG